MISGLNFSIVKLAPPISPPSMLGLLSSSETFSPDILPPYKTTKLNSVENSLFNCSFTYLQIVSASKAVALTPVPIAQTGS